MRVILPLMDGIKLPERIEDLPEDTPLVVLQKMLHKANVSSDAALDSGDLATFGAMGRLATGLSDAIRKATPPPDEDPNENPDMVAAAASVRERLHKYVRQALGDA